jgi:putative endonuclease
VSQSRGVLQRKLAPGADAEGAYGLNKRKTGAAYEQAAGYYLEQQGYVILQYNYRCRVGEIDLVAKDGDCLVFCEVKYRKTGGSGSPLEAVDFRKQQRIFRCAQYYMMEKRLGDIPSRFDVVGIEGARVTLIKNAFDGG